MTSAPTRAGFVALIGAPNAGKSTLVNRLVGAKVSIVTHKVQTTRMVIRAIVSDETTQIIFLDTPGIFATRRELDRVMVANAWRNAREADLILCLVDAARGLTEEVLEMLRQAGTLPPRKALALTKIDRIAREKLLPLAREASQAASFDAVFMISALTGDGCDELLDWLRGNLPEGPFLYPPDEISDLPMRMLAAEITREKLFLRLHEELPYASHVVTESWREQSDGSVRIEQTIIVERESQRRIVIGKGGSAIKDISMAARQELEEILNQRVHLFVRVKLLENWSGDPRQLRAMGLELPG